MQTAEADLLDIDPFELVADELPARTAEAEMTLAVAMPTAAELISRALEKYNPLQPRDREGQWTDGMPDDVVSSTLKVMGGAVTASAKRGGEGKATLSANGRSVDLDGRDIGEFRKMIIDAQYGDDSRAGSDGVFRVSRHSLGDEGKVHSEILVSLRPVEGKFITETGKKFSSLDDGPDDEEHYNAEFDMVVGEGNDGEFDDYPSTRVSLKDLDTDESDLKGLYSALWRATAARRVDTGNGPTDVFSPRAGVVGFRMKDDNGDPTEVAFNAGEARRLRTAIGDVLYGEDAGVDDLSIPRDDRVRFETSSGPVEVRFRGRVVNKDWEGTLTVFPDSAPWSVAVDGPSVDEFVDAFTESGAMAGIRNFESVNPGVHSMPLSRVLEAYAVMSPSPAVQLMMYARTLEASDTFSRRGHLITVERGRKGRFKGVGGAIADAVGAVADAVSGSEPTKRRGGGRQSAVAKALASGNSLSGFDREPLRLEAKRRGLDVPHGAHIDAIRDMLHDDHNSGGSQNQADTDADLPPKLDFSVGASPWEYSPPPARMPKRNFSVGGDGPIPPKGNWSVGSDPWQDATPDAGAPPKLDLSVASDPWGGPDNDFDRKVAAQTGRQSAQLPPAGPKQNFSVGSDPWATGDSGSSAGMRRRADKLLSDMPADKAGRDRVHAEVGGLILDADRADAADAAKSGSTVASRRQDSARIEGAFGSSVTKSLFGDGPNPLAKWTDDSWKRVTDEEVGLAPKPKPGDPDYRQPAPDPTPAERRRRKQAAYEGQKALFRREASPTGSRGGVSSTSLLGDDNGAAVAELIATEAPSLARDDNDEFLLAIAKRQGFDGPPKVVTKSEMDALTSREGGHRALYRGVQSAPGMSAAEIHEQFRSGDYFAGFNAWGHGNGSYASMQEGMAARYSDGTPGSVMRMTLRPDAKVIGDKELAEEHNAYLAKVRGTRAEAVFVDPGRYAAARGYDAIRVTSVLRKEDDHFVILNRKAVIVEQGGAGPSSAMDKLRAMRDNPQPGDSERMAAELGKLKHAELNDVETALGIENTKGTRAQRIQKIAQRAVGDKLDRDAIMRAGTADNRPPATEIEARDYFATFKAGHQAAMERDRAGRAARKAAAAKRQPVDERTANLNAISGGRNVWDDLRKAHDEEGTAGKAALPPGTAAASRRPGRPLARQLKPPTQEEYAANMAAISGGEDIWAKIRAADEEEGRSRSGGNSAKADRINQITAELSNTTDREQRSRLQAERRRLGAEAMGVPSPIDSAVDALRPIVDNPRSGDRERTDEILGRLTSRQLDEVARSYSATLGPSRNVAHKRAQLREWLVGRELDSQAIARGTTGYLDDIGGGVGPKA